MIVDTRFATLSIDTGSGRPGARSLMHRPLPWYVMGVGRLTFSNSAGEPVVVDVPWTFVLPKAEEG